MCICQCVRMFVCVGDVVGWGVCVCVGGGGEVIYY